jgi:hypothetical protein
VRYCLKQDKSPLFWPDTFDPGHFVKAGELRKNTRIAIVTERIKESYSEPDCMDKLDDDFGDVVFRNQSKILEYIDYQKDKANSRKDRIWRGLHCDTPDHELTNIVIGWFNNNICKERQIKQKQLWLWGPPSCGKSAVIFLTASKVREFEIQDNNGWIEGYRDGAYDMMFIDEFDKSTMAVASLKRLAAGYPMKIPQRNRRPIIKRENLPLIVTCQKSIEVTFSSLDYSDIEALQDRFLQVHVYEPLKKVIAL